MPPIAKQVSGVTRSYEAEIETVKDGERSVIARINTAGIDRLRTIIDPLGGDTRSFNKTASVLWEHGKSPQRGTVPIGHGWVKVRPSERDIIGKTKFANDEFSRGLFDLCKEGALRSWSINVMPHEASKPTKEEIARRPELADCEMIYRKWDLLEYSLVSVPGNSDALTLMISRGLIDAPDDYEAPPLVPEPVKQEVRSAPWIAEEAGAWCIYQPSGERLLSFPEPGLAEECLRFMSAAPVDIIGHQVAESLGQIRSAASDIKQDLVGLINLYRHGRV